MVYIYHIKKSVTGYWQLETPQSDLIAGDDREVAKSECRYAMPMRWLHLGTSSHQRPEGGWPPSAVGSRKHLGQGVFPTLNSGNRISSYKYVK